MTLSRKDILGFFLEDPEDDLSDVRQEHIDFVANCLAPLQKGSKQDVSISWTPSDRVLRVFCPCDRLRSPGTYYADGVIEGDEADLRPLAKKLLDDVIEDAYLSRCGVWVAS